MIDLSGMSNDELYEIRKQINATLKDTAVYKGDMALTARLHELLNDKLLADCHDEQAVVLGIIPSVKRAIFKICDISLGNYKLRKARGRNSNTLAVNGMVIECDPVAYKNMCNDILAVIEKYAKEEK